jgi:hypothetical protein
MAIIDSRILPLIETLVHVGADWLAFEVLEGIQAGEVSEEPHEMLRFTQMSVRSRKQPVNVRPLEEPSAQPIGLPRLGNAQLVWAAAYISGRLRDAVFMLERSFDQLENVSSLSQDRRQVGLGQSAITVVLQTGEAQLSVSRYTLDEAKVGLELLSQALKGWLDSVGIEERAE